MPTPSRRETLVCPCGMLAVAGPRRTLRAKLRREAGVRCLCGRVLTISVRGAPVWLDVPALSAAFAALRRLQPS